MHNWRNNMQSQYVTEIKNRVEQMRKNVWDNLRARYCLLGLEDDTAVELLSNENRDFIFTLLNSIGKDLENLIKLDENIIHQKNKNNTSRRKTRKLRYNRILENLDKLERLYFIEVLRN